MLKTVVDSLDGLDEAMHQFYAETDGKFVLQVDGVDDHPEVANLKNAYQRTKADRDAIRAERDQFKAKVAGLPDDFDPSKVANSEDLVKLRETLEAERDEWKGKWEASQEMARKTAIQRDLSEALIANGITDPLNVKAASALLASQVQVNDAGAAIVETDMGPVALADHVKRLAGGEFKGWVTAASGGGAKGGNGGGKPSQKRSEMSAKDKAAFIEEHGQAAYLQLPK